MSTTRTDHTERGEENTMNTVDDEKWVEEKGDDIEFALEEETDATSLDDLATQKEGVQNRTVYSNTNGRFFGYALLPPLFCTAFVFTFQFVLFTLGYGFSRNLMKLVLGLEEPRELTYKKIRMLNVHALMALGVTALAGFQVISAVRFNCTKETRQQRLRTAHRWIGRIAFLVWTVVTVLGTVAHFMIEKLDNAASIFIVSMSTLIGICTVTNMSIAIYAVAAKNEKDFFLHKCGMFFGLIWVLRGSFDEVVAMVMQLIFSSCPIGDTEFSLSIFLGESLQVFGFIAAAWWYDRAIFRSTMVRLNLVLLSIWCAFYGMASVVAYNAGGSTESGCFSSSSTMVDPDASQFEGF